MQNDEVFDLIQAHIDSEISTKDEARLQELLAQSPEYRALLEAYEQADTDLLTLQEEVPEGFTASVMQNLPKQGKKVRHFARYVGAAVAAAAALALIVGFRTAIPPLNTKAEVLEVGSPDRLSAPPAEYFDISADVPLSSETQEPANAKPPQRMTLHSSGSFEAGSSSIAITEKAFQPSESDSAMSADCVAFLFHPAGAELPELQKFTPDCTYIGVSDFYSLYSDMGLLPETDGMAYDICEYVLDYDTFAALQSTYTVSYSCVFADQSPVEVIRLVVLTPSSEE